MQAPARGSVMVAAAWIACGCGGAIKVRNGTGCIDQRGTLFLRIPTSGEDSEPGVLSVQTAEPLAVGHALRTDRPPVLGAEYREGGSRPSYVSNEVVGVIKRVADDGLSERFELKVIARNPVVDLRNAGRRGIGRRFSVERAATCGPSAVDPVE